MAAPKLRLVFYEDKTISSYYYLDKTEGLRIIAILDVLHQTDDWISASSISKMINANLAATLSTISKMAGAEKIASRCLKEEKLLQESLLLPSKKGKSILIPIQTNQNTSSRQYMCCIFENAKALIRRIYMNIIPIFENDQKRN